MPVVLMILMMALPVQAIGAEDLETLEAEIKVEPMTKVAEARLVAIPD
jgi:hypothetical protein